MYHRVRWYRSYLEAADFPWCLLMTPILYRIGGNAASGVVIALLVTALGLLLLAIRRRAKGINISHQALRYLREHGFFPRYTAEAVGRPERAGTECRRRGKGTGPDRKILP